MIMNTSTTSYYRFKHLTVAEDDNFVVLLGYRLVLTKTEYLILKALIKSEQSPLSAEQIADLSGIELSKENIAFHISSINTKAKSISGRLLIKNIVKNGYFLSEEM